MKPMLKQPKNTKGKTVYVKKTRHHVSIITRTIHFQSP